MQGEDFDARYDEMGEAKVREMLAYADELKAHFETTSALASRREQTPLASLEKPQWPAQLTKTRNYL